MRIALVVPRTKLWWTSLAVLADPETSDAKLFWAPSTTAARGLPACDRLLVSTDTAIGQDFEEVTRRFRERALLFWDGAHSIRELGASVDRLRALPALYVGGLHDQRFPWENGSLLFPQGRQRYEHIAAMLLRPSTFARLPRGNRIFLSSRSLLITAKHARQRPADAFIDRPALVFAGQSGRITLERYIEPAMGRLQALTAALRRFEAGLAVPPPDLAALSDECALATRDLDVWDRYVFWSSLARAFHLLSLRAAGLPCEFRFHPAPNINYYQSRLRRKAVYLDFGGANGDEAIYPRTADLVVLGKRIVSVRPPEEMDRASAILDLIGARARPLVQACRAALDATPARGA